MPVGVKYIHPELSDRLADHRRQRDQSVGSGRLAGSTAARSGRRLADRVLAQVGPFGAAVDPGIGKGLVEGLEIEVASAVLIAQDEGPRPVGSAVPDELEQPFECQVVDRGFGTMDESGPR